MLHAFSRRALLLTPALLAAAAFAQPANDDCADAIAITPGSPLAGSTLEALNDGISSCGISDLSPDVWYKVTSPDRKLVTATLCGGADFDTVLALHSNCPGTIANQVACNDDSACGLESTVSGIVEAGQTLFIRVAGYGGEVGDFSILVTLSDPPPPPTGGPDVIVGFLSDMEYFGQSAGVSAYAVGTDSCNIGDAPVSWYAGDNRHPVIAQNMYRLAGGRFEQIGMSWLKHGFASTNSDSCGTCTQPPDGFEQLGVGCSDLYWAGLNGEQSLLGPRSQVNPTTGVYPYPPADPAYAPVIGRRLQVATSDVNPLLNAGARYFVEGHYVTADDAQAGNGLNNASYREIQIASTTSIPSFLGPTVQQQPAIAAWAAIDNAVTLTNVDYDDAGITARFVVGHKVTDNLNGTWTYEYAVQNFNAHRAAAGFSIPAPATATVSAIGFHGVNHHSSEPFSTAPWNAARQSSAVTWGTSTFDQDPNANALRWGSLYNFRFTANTAPTPTTATLTLFRAGSPAALAISLPGPREGQGGGPGNCDPDFTEDGNVDQDDVACLIAIVAGETGCSTLDADFNQDGNVDQSDVALLIDVVAGAPCP